MKSTRALLLALIREREGAEILQEIEALCILHEKISQASECREFNRSVALLLERLEDAEHYRLADGAMNLLGSCNPKDLSQCDRVQRAREILGRIRELARENLGKCRDG